VLHLIYCLLLDETQEVIDGRTKLDEQLAAFHLPERPGRADRSDRDARAATWGKLPAHQRAMRRAVDAAGQAGQAKG
jgi:hypothetical protein